tara:strand:- start:720 stop:932 length:213 start_codon:yes stop_codon:yes gene_type:complete
MLKANGLSVSPCMKPASFIGGRSMAKRKVTVGAKAIMLKHGAPFFHHADSFARVRGGHLELAVLVACQLA